MNNFTFEFNGKLKQGIPDAEAAQRLASLFSVDVNNVNSILRGEKRFIRRDLNEFTAQSYYQAFMQCGAIGWVIDQSETQPKSSFTPESNSQPSITEATPVVPVATNTRIEESLDSSEQACPKCGSTNINETECFNCGIYFAKWRQRQDALSTPRESPLNKDSADDGLVDTVSQEDHQKAGYWLKVAALSLFGVFIADGMLVNLTTPSVRGLDFGYTPYIIAHLFLIRACMLVAVNKGYSIVTGLLGLLSLGGLAVLMLLPNKRHPDHKTDTRTFATVAFCIGIFCYASFNVITNLADLQSLKSIPVEIAMARHAYPSTTLDGDNALYTSQQKSIELLLNEKLSLLKSSNLRPNQIEEAADKIFAALSSYAAWRNYQTYLHLSQQLDLPNSLSKEGRDAHNEQIGAILTRHLGEAERQGGRLSVVYSQWFYGPMQEDTSVFWTRLNQHLNQVEERIRNAQMVASMKAQQAKLATANSNSDTNQDAPSEHGYQLDLESLNLEPPQGVKLTIEGNALIYTALRGPLAETPLVIGFYQRPYIPRPTYNNRNPSVRYMTEPATVSSEFPSKYLYGRFNPLNKLLPIPGY